MRAKPVVDCYFYPQAILFYNVFFVFLEINLANSICLFFFLFCNCYPSFHCIECPNARSSNFVVWFSIWSSLIVITDEGRNPETGWLRSYLVYKKLYIYIFFFTSYINSGSLLLPLATLEITCYPKRFTSRVLK